MTAGHIRLAVPGDGDAIARIYNHYVLSSCATFDTVPKSAEDRAEWIAERGPDQPVFVVEEEDDVIAWGSISRYAARPAWGRTAEVGIYIQPDRVGEGLGRVLLERLICRAAEVGVHALLAQIVADNGASLRLMERAGFEEVGRLREVGFKFGTFHDVVLMERII